MIVLRLLSLFAGGLTLIVPPLFMFGTRSRPEFFDGRTVVGMLAAAVLVAATFFFIGFLGDRMRKSAQLRGLGAVLLAVPFVAGMTALLRGSDPAMLWLSGLAICVSVVLFVAFVFPAAGSGKHRPMRRRESREPTLGRLAQG